MTIILGAVCFALVVLVAWERRQAEVERRAWGRERAGLIGRIQHPEVIFPPDVIDPVADAKILNQELSDDIDLVGTIQGGENGN